MALLYRLFFQHVSPLQAKALPLPQGGALFSQEGFDHFLAGGQVVPELSGQAETPTPSPQAGSPKPSPQAGSPKPSPQAGAPSDSALAGPPDWHWLRSRWAEVLPLEQTSYEGWRADIQFYANHDWNALLHREIDL